MTQPSDRNPAGDRRRPEPDDACRGSRRRTPREGGRGGERALDRLADPAPSRVGTDGATRAREVSRPTDEDLAEADRTVVLRRARRVTPS